LPPFYQRNEKDQDTWPRAQEQMIYHEAIVQDGMITQTTRAVYTKTVEQGKMVKLRLGTAKNEKQKWVEITARDAQ
jgi:hypothetical protein